MLNIEVCFFLHESLANFQGGKSTDINKGNSTGSGLSEYVKMQLDPSINWNDIKWLKTITKLPIVVKGIMTAEDALLCAELGSAAVVVSNHGARQVDGTASTVSVEVNAGLFYEFVNLTSINYLITPTNKLNNKSLILNEKELHISMKVSFFWSFVLLLCIFWNVHFI